METRGRGAFLRRRGCARIARRISVDALVVLTIAGLIALGLSPEAPRAHGDTVVASDGFNRTETGGWGSANTGGPWTVLDAASSWSVTPTAGGTVNAAANAGNRAILGSVTVRDVDLLSQIVLPRCGSNCDAFVLGRYNTNTNTYYRVGAVQGSRTQVFLRTQRSDGTFLGGDLNTAIPAAEGVVLWMRVQFQGANPTIIRARVWKDGTPEPSTWLLNTTDNTAAYQTPGAVGVRARNEDTATPHTFTYKNFQATALTATPPTSTTTPSTTTTTTTGTIPPNPVGTAASDTFQRTVTDGWGNADLGGWWTAVGSPWAWSVAPGAGRVDVSAGAEERAYQSRFNVQDVDIVEKVVLPRCVNGNCGAYVMGRYTPSYNPTYYGVGAVQGSRTHVFLRAERNDGSSLVTDVDTGVNAADGVVLWQRVQFLGTNPTTIRARVWLDGTPEPSTWQLNTTDGNAPMQKAGMVGVRLRNEDTGIARSFGVASYQVTGSAAPVAVAPNPPGPAHWLYVVVDGQVSVYDIDNNHALVKQFNIAPQAGKRGVVVAPGRGLLYVSQCGTSACAGSHGSLVAYDLVNDVVAWIANYSFGVDQPAITPDESTIYMPHSPDAGDATHSILDAANGKVVGSINTGTKGHNTIASLDGTQVYLTGWAGTTQNYAHVLNPATNQVVRDAGPTVNGVRPFTVNGKHTLMYTTSTNTCGFQVLSLTTGAVLHTVTFGGACSWGTGAPSHGISLAPDEQRVYVIDAPLGEIEVYDVSGLPTSAPTFVARVPLSSITGSESQCNTFCTREGWVLNDLSGRYVYVADSGDVISTSTLSVVATLAALRNTRQLVEIDWSNGVPSATSTRFGLGRVTN